MDVLASRSPNVVVKSTTVSKKEIVKMKAATNMRVSREKDHPPDPPSYVFEPNGLNGEAGEKYKTGGLLGKGGFAICHKGELCTERYGGFTQAFALKIVKTQMSQKKLADKVRLFDAETFPSRIAGQW